MTNRELYALVNERLKQRADSKQSLAEYLSQMWQLLSVLPTSAPLGPAAFAALLDESFDGKSQAPDFDDLVAVSQDKAELPWRQTLARQLVDLHEMTLANTLHSETRYFGIDAPRGSRWYNFEPRAFVEAGLIGTFDGWTPGDDSNRHYVPGLVSVIDEDGTLTTMSPVDLEDSIYEIESISWEHFAEFLFDGQSYE